VSVQFGRWNFDGEPVDRDYLDKVSPLLASYGPDGASSYSNENISILYRAFHTTKESRRESQPHVTSSGAILTWDGRLDNRAELIGQLGDLVTEHSTDLEIVSAAYEYRWEDCFTMLLGDWALSIWNPHTRSLILAKDPIGTRHLYYSFGDKHVSWSTILDPLVLLAGKSFGLCEEYIAGWLSFFPAAHLTPYMGICSVPPSSLVVMQAGKHMVNRYWDFDPGKKIRYRTDCEYEEHFRSVFAEAIQRRLRSDAPVLAELSGGMDSSSTVCMADTLFANGSPEAPRLDTISYYNDCEPNWNERSYFTKVEEKRGHTGCHIDLNKRGPFNFESDPGHFAAAPGSAGHRNQATRQFAACLASQGNRVVLSGIGGDEVMGGVPTPAPELADLLVSGRVLALAHQLKRWALNKRKPWFHLFFEAARVFFSPALVGVPNHLHPLPWLNPDFVRRNRSALQGYNCRLKLFGPLPTFQGNISTLEALQRQLGCEALQSDPPYEKCYPYIDRDLLEFVYAVPREQLVRPGHRRSLMRRALTGVVPGEVLNRKRKAYSGRAAMADIATQWAALENMRHHALICLVGIVDQLKFGDVLQRGRHGQEIPIVGLMRTFCVESWLQGLGKLTMTGGRLSVGAIPYPPLNTRETLTAFF
jgi:asparagine synthase (glutamine-hydrolysing)